MKNRRAAIVALFLILVLTVFLVACGGVKTEQAKEAQGAKPQKVEPSTGGSRVKLKNERGELVIDAKSAKLPRDWPSDMPVFPKSRIASAVSGTGEANITMVVLRSGSTVAGIREFYEKTLRDGGWTIDNLLESGGQTIAITASKGERAASLSINNDADSGDSIISINLFSKP